MDAQEQPRLGGFQRCPGTRNRACDDSALSGQGVKKTAIFSGLAFFRAAPASISAVCLPMENATIPKYPSKKAFQLTVFMIEWALVRFAYLCICTNS